VIPGKRAAGGISAMQAWGEPDNQQPAALVTKLRDGSTKIIRVTVFDLTEKAR
tara:strand:- start:89 stop:247 length:159 start_codon:yes stop_codon:yes gene_type:complete